MVLLQTAIMLSPRRAPLLQKELHGAVVRHGALAAQSSFIHEALISHFQEHATELSGTYNMKQHTHAAPPTAIL